MTIKKLLIPVLAFSVLLAGSTVLATTAKADDLDNRPPFIQKLAERFNLNQDEVDSFFQEQRQQHQQQMQEQKEQKLQQAVDDGVITAAQKEAITAKHQEKMGNRQENRQEMQQWFEDQGIDHQALFSYMKPDKGSRGMHHPW